MHCSLSINTTRWTLRFVFSVLVALLHCSVAEGQVLRSFAEPVERSHVAAAEPGVLQQIVVKEGQRVTKGQALGELNNDVLQQTLEIARLKANSDAKLRSANANLRLFQKKFEKLRPLLEAGHANNAEVEQAQVEYEAALAEFEIAQQELQENRLEVSRIEAQIKRRVIHSPIDGWITAIHHRPGEYIATSSPEVATIVQLDRLRVRFYLLASTADQLQVGSVVPINVGTRNKQARVPTVVEFVSPVIDPDSGTVRVDLLIDNSNLSLRSGTPCQWIVKQDREDAVVGDQP